MNKYNILTITYHCLSGTPITDIVLACFTRIKQTIEVLPNEYYSLINVHRSHEIQINQMKIILHVFTW